MGFPKYQLIRDELQSEILSVAFKPGDQFYSERELIERFEVSSITVIRAIRDLADMGYLIRRQGVGTFISRARKKQQVVEMKEVQLSCRIDTHDFETKARHAQTFLSKGNKVRVVMRFKGREMSHMAIGREIMDKFIASCAELGAPEKKPVLDGRSLSTVIAPLKPGAKDAKKKSESTGSEE